MQGPSCPQELGAHMSLPCPTMVLPELHPTSFCSTSLHKPSFQHILAWIWPLCRAPQAAPQLSLLVEGSGSASLTSTARKTWENQLKCLGFSILVLC